MLGLRDDGWARWFESLAGLEVDPTLRARLVDVAGRVRDGTIVGSSVAYGVLSGRVEK